MFHKTSLIGLANNKHSNLLGLFISYDENELLWIRYLGRYSQSNLRTIYNNYFRRGSYPKSDDGIWAKPFVRKAPQDLKNDRKKFCEYSPVFIVERKEALSDEFNKIFFLIIALT